MTIVWLFIVTCKLILQANQANTQDNQDIAGEDDGLGIVGDDMLDDTDWGDMGIGDISDIFGDFKPDPVDQVSALLVSSYY